MKFPKIAFFFLLLCGCVGTPPEKESLWKAGIKNTGNGIGYRPPLPDTNEVSHQVHTYLSKHLPASEKIFVNALKNEGMFCSVSTVNKRENACTYSLSHRPAPCSKAFRLSLTVYFPVKPMYVENKNGSVSPNPEPEVIIKDIRVASAVTIDEENHETRGVLFCK